MGFPSPLYESNAWTVSGIRTADVFFRAVHALVPEATHMCLEGSPEPYVMAILAEAADGEAYEAPAGTIWSWPNRSRRISVRVSELRLLRLAEVASHHAEPEICDHVDSYRGPEPLLQWFDAFLDPLLVSRAVPRERVSEFCSRVHGVMFDGAA